MNRVILSGNSTKDIEMVKIGDTKIGKFTIAVSRTYKNEYGNYETDFIDCLAFDNIAENTELYCKKGDIIFIYWKMGVFLWLKRNGETGKTASGLRIFPP